MALQEAAATREQGKGFFGKLTKGLLRYEAGSGRGRRYETVKRSDAPDVVAAANRLVLQRVHDFLRTNVTARLRCRRAPPTRRQVPRADDRRGAGGARGGHVGRPKKAAFGDGFADVLNEVAVAGQALKDSHVADVKAPTYVAKPAPSTWRGRI